MAIPLIEEATTEETVPEGIKEVLDSYTDIMPESLPQTLQPRRGIDDKIELLPGVKPPTKNAYRMAPPELAELRKQLDELLKAGFIRPNLPTEETSWERAEELNSPFGLTNAPATFCTLMNQVFYEYPDQSVIVYLDDIVVYSTTLEEHKVHLKLVFDKLRQNQLYVKKEKLVSKLCKLREIAKTENMSMTKSTPKSQADRLTLIEEEMLFLKEVPDTIRFLEARVKELSGKVVEINAMGNCLDGLPIEELMF
ncbi:uncharacterized protein LOC111436556 [Cucurbita moschata]|uniref:Uncharacterized protein LOC111436556 n=1 Tax=Cucurbita moschata TaxID=3662 RepID=A0A6J1EQK2_CUCMO|nr:uncharacterized protein LOC111436556 [Cucurbita moschata]